MQVHWPKPCKARSAPDFNTWPAGGCSSILHSGAPLCSKCLSPHFKREIMGNQSSYEPWCSQVSYLHCSLGYMHRDLKPENVMMTKTDHLKLIDFGSAAAIDGSDGVSEVIPLCYILVACSNLMYAFCAPQGIGVCWHSQVPLSGALGGSLMFSWWP